MRQTLSKSELKTISNFVVAIFTISAASLSIAQTFSFGAYGDMPYGPDQMAEFPSLVQALDSAQIEWVIHVGDIKAAATPCTEELLQSRISDINSIKHSVVYVPGDNEWTDCWYQTESTPIEWLTLLRRIAYPDLGKSLGEPSMDIERQLSEGSGVVEYPEHQSWAKSGVYFTTLHLVGSDNGLADFPNRSEEHNVEVINRINASVDWLNQSFSTATDMDSVAVVVAIHANPFQELNESNADYSVQPFTNFLETLARRAEEYGKPVLLIHGDSHTFRFDRPLRNFDTGAIVENVYRLEVFGAPETGWVEVVVDPEAPAVFSIRPQRIAPD